MVFLRNRIMNTAPLPADDHTSSVPLGSDPVIAESLPVEKREENLEFAATCKVWRSEELLGREPEVIIMHQGKAYRLRSTRQGKLILYK